MSILSKATSGRRGRAQKVVIYAPEGFGKSTIASQFPDPFFLDVEDSTSQLDVNRLESADLPDLKAFESALGEMAKKPNCSTLVVDTIDWLEQMAVAELCAEHKANNIEEVAGGFGKGYSYLTNRVAVTLAKLDAVIAAGVHIVLLAHSSIVRFDPPDGAGAFDRYELKLFKDRKAGKGTASLIKEWADMVLFGNYRVQISEKGKGDNIKYKGVGGKEHMMYCNRCAAWDAKNRHGMADVEKWEIGVIEKAFRQVGAPWGDPAAAPVVADSVVAKVEAPVVVKTEEPKPVVIKDEPKVEAKLVEVKAEPKLDTTTRYEFNETKTLVEDPDQIPGLPVIPAKHAEAAADPCPVFTKTCFDNFEVVTAWMIANGKITARQTWQDAPESLKKQIDKNPAGFLQVAKKRFNEQQKAAA